MRHLPDDMDPEFWISHVFSAKTALKGGVIRRKTRDIDRITGRSRFLEEVRRRGFHAVENGGNIVVFCNNAPVHFLM